MNEEPKTVKPLPREPDGSYSRHFTANGVRYTIRTADEGTTIERYTAMKKMGVALGFSSSFEALVREVEGVEGLLNTLVTKEPKLRDTFLRLNNLKRGILETSRTRYDLSLYYCTLFIVRDGEDLTQWVQAEQDEKIADWNAEGYDVHDFLRLGLSTVEGFTAVYARLYEQMANGLMEGPTTDMN